MARLGAFDAELRHVVLFDPTVVADGWYSNDLIDVAPSGLSPDILATIIGGHLIQGALYV